MCVRKELMGHTNKTLVWKKLENFNYNTILYPFTS